MHTQYASSAGLEVEYKVSVKALFIDALPGSIESQKSRNPSQTPIFGAAVYVSSLIDALLKYGVYDEYFFFTHDPLSSSCFTDLISTLPNPERVRVISPATVQTLGSHDHLVLVAPRAPLNTISPLRTYHSSLSWPIVGFTHALNGITVPYIMMGLFLADIQPTDAIVCTTEAARKVVNRLCERIARSLRRQRRPDGGFAPVQLPVIPNGSDCAEPLSSERADTRRSLGIAEDATLILYVGRFSTTDKGDLEPIILAFSRHLRARNAILLLAGDDVHDGIAPTLSASARMLDCEATVLIKPNITYREKRAFLAAADIFISFSDNLQETFGLSLIEAMAAALPVVVSDWNGYKEVIKHGEDGFLVPCYWPDLGQTFDFTGLSGTFSLRDSYLAAATAVDCKKMVEYLIALIEHRDLRIRMGQTGRRHALEKFHWPIVIRQYEALWDELTCQAQVSASRRPARKSQLSAISFPCQELFEHYPTRRLSDSDVVSVGPTGQWWLERNGHLGACNDGTGFSADLLKTITSSVAISGPITVARLKALCRTEGCEAGLHLSRLLKYGVLELS